MSKAEVYIKKITSLLEDLDYLKNKKENFFRDIKDKTKREALMEGKTEEYWKDYYNAKLKELLDEIEELNNQVAESLIAREEYKAETSLKGEFTRISKKERKEYLGELKIEREELKKALSGKAEAVSAKEIGYTLYETNKYGKLANYFAEKIGLYLNRKYPGFFGAEHEALKSSGINILSKTYDSIIIFTSIIAFIAVLILVIAFSITAKVSIISSIIRGISFAFLASAAVFGFVYYYPFIVIGNRNRAIKNDLPFVIIHMAAVAGSGAQPISMFNLVLSSKEYKGLEGEIRKIVNYVNLFGYSLTSALRTVAATTPSKDFRELLTGIVASVETGGDLKAYLKGKAEDALNTYRMDRKKYTETLAAYSDIYTGAFIAAPLLFLVTLAIINVIGGSLGALDARTIAMIGTFGVIPFLNVAYIVFLSIMQPET